MIRLLSTLAFAALSFAAVPSYAAAPDVAPDLDLYRLDCGHMTLGDKSLMSDRGLYHGQSYDIVMSCYLIKHGNDWLLWDAGLPRTYLGSARTEGSFTTALDRTIVDQIRELGLRPDDIKYVIIQRAELAAIADTGKATAHYIDPALFRAHISGPALNRVRVIDGEVDLFGDGTLKTIGTPGHTPGSMALLVNLKHAGPYVLSGDQWHFTENHERAQVPTWNYDHDQTIGSGKKLDEVIARTHATLVIQHEPVDNARLPKLPGFLD
jgi:N-acyl homoserine lactone hydrolase